MGQLKLDVEDVELIKHLCSNTSLKDKAIAEMFGVSRKHINTIRNKKRWNYDYGQSTREAIVRAIERGIDIHR